MSEIQNVLDGFPPWTIVCGDSLEIMKAMPDNCVDLVFTSPPYEDARKGAGSLSGGDWVRWCSAFFIESHRICRGLTAFVVDGRTEKFCWSGTPMRLCFTLLYSGIPLRKPAIFHRRGIPGSGGPDWWRNDYEFIICASKGRLPWSNPTACGKPPKFGPGGNMSHRKQDGTRVAPKKYKPPKIANPGNVISLKVGGGHMGHRLCHKNEAPFPEALPERYILSFCRPGGIVCDPFVGSGTTVAMALKHGRRGIGIELRKEQADNAVERIEDQIKNEFSKPLQRKE